MESYIDSQHMVDVTLFIMENTFRIYYFYYLEWYISTKSASQSFTLVTVAALTD
jgi:hypothetical protein